MNPVYALYKTNTWWKLGEIDSSHKHKRIRSEISDVVRSLIDRRITNIAGPSSVGKSSLLYDTVSNLLNAKIPPRRILLFSGNDMTLFGEHRSVGSLLETYATDVLHENLFDFKAPVYILIDDIHFIDDWQIYLLNYQKKASNIKFIIAQVNCIVDTQDADCFCNIYLGPLTQQQFTEFYCASKAPEIDLVRYKSLLPDINFFEDPGEFVRILEENIYPLSDFKPQKTRIIDEYLLAGGYPSYFESADTAGWQRKLADTVDLALYRDVAALSGLKAPQKLKRLLYIVGANGSKEQSYGSIGRELYVDTSTIIGYISALNKGGYAGVAENYCLQSNIEGRIVRKNKRLYIMDCGVANALLNIPDITETYEVSVKRAVMYIARKYADEKNGSVFFWKDGNRNADMVVSTQSILMPISICYARSAQEKCAKSIKAFMKYYDVKKAVIITKDVLKAEGRIFYIPYWMI